MGYKPINPLDFLKDSLNQLNIQFEVLEDDDGFFIFPRGVKEFDEALVSFTLQWLNEYPKTKLLYSKTLRLISDNSAPRDCIDNLRLSFEVFLQEFFSNEKNLENNKSEVGKYLKEQGINSEINQMIQTLINEYRLLNDRNAKHHDNIDQRSVEYMLYQTGIFIRLLIILDNDSIQYGDKLSNDK